MVWRRSQKPKVFFLKYFEGYWNQVTLGFSLPSKVSPTSKNEVFFESGEERPLWIRFLSTVTEDHEARIALHLTDSLYKDFTLRLDWSGEGFIEFDCGASSFKNALTYAERFHTHRENKPISELLDADGNIIDGNPTGYSNETLHGLTPAEKASLDAIVLAHSGHLSATRPHPTRSHHSLGEVSQLSGAKFEAAVRQAKKALRAV